MIPDQSEMGLQLVSNWSATYRQLFDADTAIGLLLVETDQLLVCESSATERGLAGD